MHSRGKAIGLGVHMYVCVYVRKKIKWHFSVGLTFSNTTVFIIGERAKRVRHPLFCYLSKKSVYSMYVKTTMRMLTILREAKEWMRVHLREAYLLFASAIMKSLLYVRQNDKRMHIK